MKSKTETVHEALAPFKIPNKRLLRGPGGEAYTIRDAEGAFRYMYDNYELDEKSAVDNRVPTREVARYGNWLLTRSHQDTQAAHGRRLEFIEEALALPESEASVKAETLRHLGLVAVLPPEAESSIIPFELPKTATVAAHQPRLDKVA